MVDDQSDQTTSPGEDPLDIVGNNHNCAAFWYLDDANLYLRMRVNYDPAEDGYMGSWAALFETNGDVSDFESIASLAGYGSRIAFFLNSKGTDGPGALATTSAGNIKAKGLYQLDSRDPVFGGDDDYYVDLALPLAEIYKRGVLASSDEFQVCFGTSSSTDGSSIDRDTMGHNDASGFGTLSDCLADAISIDGDEDGLDWFEELDWGTSQKNADSDEDGLLDGEEADLHDAKTGCPSPTNPDSDDDGLRDGEEEPNNADLCDEDSDDDGLADGVEVAFGTLCDTEHSDADKFTDKEEFDCAEGDAGSDPDDRDGDGIEDAVEGTADPDGDKKPAWCDEDADGDGTLDVKEGEEDADCDGTPNYLDPDDSDGECTKETGDPDADADTDVDTDTDTDMDSDSDASCDSGDQFCGGKLSGGCSCGGGHGLALLLPGLLVGLLLVGRRRLRSLALLLLALSVPQAQAQGLNAQNLQPALDGRSLLALDDSLLAAPGPGGGLLFNYGRDPVIYVTDDEIDHVVEAMGTLDLMAFYGFKHFRLGADVPLNPLMTGSGVQDSALLGDIALDAKAQLMDRRSHPLGISLSARLGLPTGNRDAWAGTGNTTMRALLGISAGSRLMVAANAGVATGSNAQDLQETFGLTWGTSLLWGAGASLPFGDRIWTSAEVVGRSVFGNHDARAYTNPIEALLSLRVNPAGQLLLTAGGGMPLTTGVGAPQWRALAGLSWVPAPREGVVRARHGDMDGDSIPDSADRCPQQPEDSNGQDDHDGCPDGKLTATVLHVKDSTGALLAGARLTLSEGPVTGDFVSDGGSLTRSLPPGSYRIQVSAEGFASREDELRIPMAARHEASYRLQPLSMTGRLELVTTDPQGAPLAATVRVLGPQGRRFAAQADGVQEISLPPGSYDLVVAAEGHAVERRSVSLEASSSTRMEVILKPVRSARVRVAGERILLNEKIFFELGSATVKQESFGLLDEVAMVILDHPEILLVEIHGHTDDQGEADFNLKLSRQRAEAVLMYMSSRGVPGGRMEAKGFGEAYPLQPGESDEARAVNRRVELHIKKRAVEPAPPEKKRKR